MTSTSTTTPTNRITFLPIPGTSIHRYVDDGSSVGSGCEPAMNERRTPRGRLSPTARQGSARPASGEVFDRLTRDGDREVAAHGLRVELEVDLDRPIADGDRQGTRALPPPRVLAEP